MSTNTILASAPLTATGYHLKATGTTLGQSLIWDNGTNVGIGNTNTSYTLDVTGSGRYNNASAMALQVNGGTFTQATASSYSLGVGNTGGYDLTLGTSTTAGVIQTWSSKPLSLNPQGNNVLIGSTTDSSYKLDVTGTVRFSSTLLVSGAATFSSSVSATTNAIGTITSTGSAALGGGGNILFNDTASDSNTRNWAIGLGIGPLNYGDLGILVGASIGASPSSLKMIITRAGNVGIGLTSPTYKLDVSGTSGTYIRVAETNGAEGFGAGVRAVAGSTDFGFVVADSLFSLYDFGGGGRRLNITSTGNVGVGTTTPATKLAVAGCVQVGNNTDGTASLSYGGRISAKMTDVTGGGGATVIHRGLGSVGYFILVSSLGGPSNTYRFTDLIYGTGTGSAPSVLASSTVGSPPTRTYSMSGENVALSLSGSSVYTVTTTGLGANES